MFEISVGLTRTSSPRSFVPSVWLPTYTHDVEMYKPTGTALISIMNGASLPLASALHSSKHFADTFSLLPQIAASVPGLLLMGYLSDHVPLRLVIVASCLGSALSCLFLWGFASQSAALLIVFAISFGLLALSFTAVWTKLISVISSKLPHGSIVFDHSFAHTDD
jgi:MFS family permease